MNIETANRLYELRKKNGYSQEELAAKLGLSRQAVSKWERAEASPDTDNLVELAKLYGISLDELLDLDISVDVLSRPHKATKEELDPKKYGVIVIQGHKKGLLLPDLEGVDSVDYQLEIACEKAGISPSEEYEIERFEVKRYKEEE